MGMLPVNIFKFVTVRSPVAFDKRGYKQKRAYKRRKDIQRAYRGKAADIDALLKYNVDGWNNSEILFGFSSRFKENFSCVINESFKAVFENADFPEKLGFSIVVDKDDDLAFYNDFLAKNKDKNIRFFLSDKRYGVEGLHKYDKIIFDNLPKKCSIFFDFSDDAIVKQKGFDSYIFDVQKKFDDNIFIIHTRDDLYKSYLPDFSENKMLIPWIQKAGSPASLFPIISRRIIEIAKDVIKELDIEGSEWSPLADTWIYDCYIDYIAYEMKAAGLRDRVFYSDMVKRMTRFDKFNAHNTLYDQHGMNKSDRAFIKMYSNDSLKVLDKICEKIIQTAKNK